MLQVTSTLVVKPRFRDQALALAEEHVALSLQEEGCISHAVYLHPSKPNELFFYERWADEAALHLHFAKPYSAKLIQSMSAWATEPMSLVISVIDSEQIQSIA